MREEIERMGVRLSSLEQHLREKEQRIVSLEIDLASMAEELDSVRQGVDAASADSSNAATLLSVGGGASTNAPISAHTGIDARETSFGTFELSLNSPLRHRFMPSLDGDDHPTADSGKVYVRAGSWEYTHQYSGDAEPTPQRAEWEAATLPKNVDEDKVYLVATLDPKDSAETATVTMSYKIKAERPDPLDELNRLIAKVEVNDDFGVVDIVDRYQYGDIKPIGAGAAGEALPLHLMWWDAEYEEYRNCCPEFTAGKFWYLHELKTEEVEIDSGPPIVNENQQWLCMRQICLPLETQPGFCPYDSATSGTAPQFVDENGDLADLSIVDGVLTGSGGPHAGTLVGIDPSSGDELSLSVTDGKVTGGYTGTVQFVDTNSGENVDIRVGADGSIYGGRPA